MSVFPGSCGVADVLLRRSLHACVKACGLGLAVAYTVKAAIQAHFGEQTPPLDTIHISGRGLCISSHSFAPSVVETFVSCEIVCGASEPRKGSLDTCPKADLKSHTW